MLHVTERVIGAFKSHEGEVIAEFLKKHLAEETAACMTADGVILHRAQGAAQILKELTVLAKKT